jgi:hypothetical protein
MVSDGMHHVGRSVFLAQEVHGFRLERLPVRVIWVIRFEMFGAGRDEYVDGYHSPFTGFDLHLIKPYFNIRSRITGAGQSLIQVHLLGVRIQGLALAFDVRTVATDITHRL